MSLHNIVVEDHPDPAESPVSESRIEALVVEAYARARAAVMHSEALRERARRLAEERRRSAVALALRLARVGRGR
jgi:hypothetical protein